MIKIGLTGGIGSGKSTVSKMLANMGITVIDADLISKDVLEKYPEIYEKIRINFGEGFFDWRGEFRRKEFGNHIFRFPKQRKKYEELIIPYIKNEIMDKLNQYEKEGLRLVVLDAPTLIENDLHTNMDYVILVSVDNNTQMQRIKERDKLGREDIINRINSQMPLERKREYADIIIDNNSTLLKTKSQIDGVVEFLRTIC
ncbi:dephospho-CoA kinase [Clostridium sp.]|uniref:dephospho-CoA kinase n=1 Tax=Clostridium sp. TaxID=1506 RepID=UPI003F38E835